VLHRAVRENVESFLAHASDRGRPVPRFVEREMRGFLECGILAHGFVRVHCDACGHDRARLERLCRYVARPPVATKRLARLPDGRLLYRLQRPWRDGTTHFVFEPEELLERLAALVPPPRAHQVRYHGVLAPCASRRPRVVPLPPSVAPSPCSGPTSSAAAVACVPAPALEQDGPREPLPLLRATGARSERNDPPVPAGRGAQPSTPRRLSWAELMQRVFAIDVLRCPRCGGRMRVLAAIHDPQAVRAILECLGLASRPPPTHPARTDPHLSDLDV
jgi:hypothetical protein